MKRILVAAGVAVAALSLPATAAFADGYERKQVAKPKPKPKAKAHKKHHAKPVHRYEEKVVDHARHYGAGHRVVHVKKHEEYARTYYEERDGHVVAHYGVKVNAREGCHPSAPCTWGFGPQQPVAVGHGWGSWGHAGGVGYGVDGGYHGWAPYSPYAAGWTSYSRSVSEHRSSTKTHGWKGGHHGGGMHPGMGGHPGKGHPGMGGHHGMSGHHGMAGHHGVGVQHGGGMHMAPGMHPGGPGPVEVHIQRGPGHPPMHPPVMHHPRPRGW